MIGIIDVLWEEIMAFWDREHLGLTGEELAVTREEYQISLTARAAKEREK